MNEEEIVRKIDLMEEDYHGIINCTGTPIEKGDFELGFNSGYRRGEKSQLDQLEEWVEKQDVIHTFCDKAQHSIDLDDLSEKIKELKK